MSAVSVVLPLYLQGALTYAAPAGMVLAAGDLVEVPLGKKRVKGVVWATECDAPKGVSLKPVIRKLETPPLSKNLRRFIDWVADYTLSAAGMVLKMAISIPDALEVEEQVEAYRLATMPPPYPSPAKDGRGSKGVKITPVRQKILDELTASAPLTMAQLLQQSGASRAQVKGLLLSGALEVTHIAPKPEVMPIMSKLNIQLSPAQTEAAQNICEKVAAQRYSTTLLDGVTGSGKTEVYFTAIEEALKIDGAQVLIMLPEIALTTQLVTRFTEKFGCAPHQWHSGLTPLAREKNWRDVATGRARLVIGARSALFLPYKNLRLIIVDEEHDGSYKQEEGVMYHARDMAVVRGSLEPCPVVLASATPSIETVENVRAGKYDMLVLPSRYGVAVMPDIQVVDMRREKLPTARWLSVPLQKALAENLDAGRQSMLFLNRRGYAPLTLCRECGFRFQCPECSSWLVEHKSHNKLMCHHCGFTQPIPRVCPECESEDKLVSCGPGVERIAEEVSGLFPEANLCLMTSDKMTSHSKTGAMVSDITDGNVDIIIGTQMIAKGYHFPRLTHVGVVDADLGMEGGDVRASERTFQLLQQVSGRAGREAHKGTVILQSYMPENAVMRSLAAGSRDAFIDTEIASRKKTLMPPYARLAALIISGREERQVMLAARALAAAAPVQESIRILGPVPAPIFRLRGQYRYRILVKTARTIHVQKWLRALLGSVKLPSGITVRVDVDPYSFM